MKKRRTDKSIEDYKKVKKKIKFKVKPINKAEISKMFKNRNMKNLQVSTTFVDKKPARRRTWYFKILQVGCPLQTPWNVQIYFQVHLRARLTSWFNKLAGKTQ